MLPFALCFLLLLQNLFWLLGLLLEEAEGSAPAHTAERSQHPFPVHPLLHHRDQLQQLHSPQQPCCTEKEGLSPLRFPFSSSSFIPQPLPPAKSSNIHEIAEKYSVSSARKSILPLEWTSLLRDGAQRVPDSRTGMKIWGRGRDRANWWKPSWTWLYTLHLSHCVPRSIAKSETFSQM